MADLSDVEFALANFIRDAFYPNGTNNPSIVPSVGTIRVYPGWPTPKNLEDDLPLNNVHVTVWPLPSNRNTTRFREEWEEEFINPPTITLTVAGNTLTVGGTVTTNGQTCMVIMNKIGYAYTVQAGDTLASIASAIAGLVPSANAVGNVVTVPAAYSLVGRMTTSGGVVMEFKRQQQMFQVTVWTGNYAARAACAPVVDQSLGFIKRLLIASDNFWAPITHMHTKEFDQFDKTPVYRRDLIYQVEYATTLRQTAYTISDPYANVSISDSIN
jgi:hypothetical protein